MYKFFLPIFKHHFPSTFLVNQVFGSSDREANYPLIVRNLFPPSLLTLQVYFKKLSFITYSNITQKRIIPTKKILGWHYVSLIVYKSMNQIPIKDWEKYHYFPNVSFTFEISSSGASYETIINLIFLFPCFSLFPIFISSNSGMIDNKCLQQLSNCIQRKHFFVFSAWNDKLIRQDVTIAQRKYKKDNSEKTVSTQA